jgi:hypothetical protein
VAESNGRHSRSWKSLPPSPRTVDRPKRRTVQEQKATIQQIDIHKLAQIGKKDERLDGIKANLPPSYSIIYEVTLLDDAQLEEAVRDGVIHPRVCRAEIAAIRKPSSQRCSCELPRRRSWFSRRHYALW